MTLRTDLGLLVALVCAVTCTYGKNVYFKTPPAWPPMYTVSGTLQLPYAEINEPFKAYFDTKGNRSKVNYYGDSVSTIQLAAHGSSFGQSFKVVPTFLGGKQTKSCFLVNETKESLTTSQTVLPDLTGFKPAGQAKMNGKDCDMWQKVVVVGLKKNTYTMWTDKKGGPVRYEMMGFDSLLGSHYDKYYLDYDTMSPKNISDDEFKPPKAMKCGNFPGPGIAERRISMNPMQEYVNGDDRHTSEMFDHFKKTHNKQYKDQSEHSKRMHTFRQNVRFISSKNRAGLSYTLKVNHMTDLFDEELRQMNGRTHTSAYNGGLPFDKSQYDPKGVPEQVDWRLYGAVTPVKDQAVCGSCWSFGSTGTLEGAYFLKTGRLVRLSQQELMDCSWDQGNNACDGGEDFRSYDFVKKFGLSSQDSYGPYRAQDSDCRMQNATKVLTTLKSFVNVTPGDMQALKMALAKHGPISVSIDASHKSLSYYANGVYFESKCGNKPDNLDHSVLAVGYGVLNGQPYWLIKNSWSTYWGNDGYVLMSMKDNNCGVATAPTFVNL